MLTRGPIALAIADITTCKPEEEKNRINFQHFCRVEPSFNYNELKKHVENIRVSLKFVMVNFK